MAAKKKQTLDDFLKSEKYCDYATTLSFEDGLALLEELVNTVESGELPLEQAIGSYERGVALVESLRKKLEGAEERLRLLNKDSEAEKN